MRCESCGSENPEGLKFCNECGTLFKARCGSCGFENQPRAKFCGDCGQPLSPPPAVSQSVPQVASSPAPLTYTPPHLAERILAEQVALEARGATDGERKTITALFADLKGSTALIEGLDPEDARGPSSTPPCSS